MDAFGVRSLCAVVGVRIRRSKQAPHQTRFGVQDRCWNVGSHMAPVTLEFGRALGLLATSSQAPRFRKCLALDWAHTSQTPPVVTLVGHLHPCIPWQPLSLRRLCHGATLLVRVFRKRPSHRSRTSGSATILQSTRHLLRLVSTL